MNIGNGIKYARHRAGLNQAQLAARVGVRESYISRLEGGRQKNPSHQLIEKMATACGIPAVVIYIASVDAADMGSSKTTADMKKEIALTQFLN